MNAAGLDALSRLLSQHPVRTTLDSRCQLAAKSRVDHSTESSSAAPYHLVLDGTVLLHLEGRAPLLLRAGDMLVLPNGDAHGLSTPEGADILCGQFHAGASATSVLFNVLPTIVLVSTADRPELAKMGALAMMLRDEANAKLPGTGAVSSHLASALFALLLRAWLEEAGSVPGLFGLLAEPRLSPALQHMLKAPGAPCNVEQMADACHMSRTTLIRLFRDAAGNGPGEVLTHFRMVQAAQWLGLGTRSVRDIGEAAGYQSEAAFNRAFKRYHGVGPGEFRRGHPRARAEILGA
jgi:AraC family transcriptional activator of mtrCDE